jgi:RNA recognition motif-containing protein
MGQPIKIYVGNIPQSARNSELKELFEKFGKVVECDILKEFAFVHMDDTNDAKAAIAGLNDSLWKGSRIRVELSTTKTSKGEPSMRHKLGADDLSRNLRRGRSYERDRARSPPGYMRGNGRDSGRGYDNRFGPNPYRQNDMRGPPMRDSRYGPPHRGRPYPDPYDRRGAYPHDQRIPMRGQAYSPEYQFHPSSYHREPMRDHRAHYVDPYGRPPMSAYGQPMPYYRGPPPNASRYDYSPQGYPNSRPR